MESLLSVALSAQHGAGALGVIPVMVGPLNALIAALPAIGLALFALVVTLFKPSTMKRLAMLLWQQKLAVCAIVVILVGCYYGYARLFGASFSTKAKVSAGPAEWLAFHGNADRRGYVDIKSKLGKSVEDPAHGQVNWSFKDGSTTTFYSSPAVVGNRVYVTGAYNGLYGPSGIYSIDADSGKLVWAFHGDGYRATFSSPAVWGKYLVVGEGLHETKDSRIFCIDIDQSEAKHEGVKLWDYRTTSHMESSPCIDKENHDVIVGGADDGVYCFKLDGDKDKHGQLVWQLPGKDYPDCEGSPVIYEGKLYFGLGREIHAMCCADPKTGSPLWRVLAPYSTASPAVANGKLFFGMGVGDFIYDAAGLRAIKEKELQVQHKSQAEIDAALKELPDAGQLWCIDLKTHNVDWKFDIGQTVLGTPAIDEDRVYFGAHNGMLYCLSTEGPAKLNRKFNAHGPIVSGPSVGSKYVYVTTTAGMLYALDKQTLAMVWSVGLNNGSFSSPALANGHVYVGTNGAGLLSVGLPGREKDEPLWPGQLGGAGHSGTVDGSRIAGLGGLFAWGYTEGDVDDSGAPSFTVKSPAAIIDTTFFVGVSQKGANGVEALECGAGQKSETADDDDEAARLAQVLGSKPRQAWLAKSKNAVTLSPAATEDYVFFVDGKLGDTGRMLHCVNRRTGKELWNNPVADDASGECSINRENLFIADTAKGVSCFKITGGKEPVWTVDVGGCVGMPGVTGDFVAVATNNPAALLVLDGGTGLTLWQEKLAETPRTGAVVFRDRVWTGTPTGVEAYNLIAGQEQLPPIACGPMKGSIICDVDHLAFMTEAGELIVCDAEPQAAAAATAKEAVATSAPASAPASPPAAKAREIHRIKGVIATIPPILVDDAMLYCTKNSIQRYDLQSKKSTLWASITPDFPGAIVTPMVMMNSHLFFGTEIEGFVCFKPKKDQ